MLNACMACWRGTMLSSNQDNPCPVMLTAPCLVLASLNALLLLDRVPDARPVQMLERHPASNSAQSSSQSCMLSSAGLPRLLTLMSSSSQGTSTGDAALASPLLSRRTCHEGPACDLIAAGQPLIARHTARVYLSRCSS